VEIVNRRKVLNCIPYVNDLDMSVRRNFSRGDATSTLCLSFSGCWWCRANGCSQNASRFLHRKENALR